MEDTKDDQLALTDLLGFLRSLTVAIDDLAAANLRLKESLENEMPEPAKRVIAQERSRILLFADVPETHRRKKEIHDAKKLRNEAVRCCAAIRPWLNGMDDRGVFCRCNGKQTSDGLCKVHLRIRECVGSCDWNEERVRVGL